MAVKVDVKDVFGRKVDKIKGLKLPATLRGGSTAIIDGFNLNPFDACTNPLRGGLRRRIVVKSLYDGEGHEPGQVGRVDEMEGSLPLMMDRPSIPVRLGPPSQIRIFPYRVTVTGLEE